MDPAIFDRPRQRAPRARERGQVLRLVPHAARGQDERLLARGLEGSGRARVVDHRRTRGRAVVTLDRLAHPARRGDDVRRRGEPLAHGGLVASPLRRSRLAAHGLPPGERACAHGDDLRAREAARRERDAVEVHEVAAVAALENRRATRRRPRRRATRHPAIRARAARARAARPAPRPPRARAPSAPARAPRAPRRCRARAGRAPDPDRA